MIYRKRYPMTKIEKKKNNATALFIVDMQNYYLSPDSDYFRYFDAQQKGCLSYIHERCAEVVIPNLTRIIPLFRQTGALLIYLKLCGKKPDRSDLHPFFMDTHRNGIAAGFSNVYPTCDDPMAGIVDRLKPEKGDLVVTKGTFSPFTSSGMEDILRENDIAVCYFAGLSTSQCVETTARDASDRGFRVLHIEDCQADYDELTHSASLYSSRGVCGGSITTSIEVISSIGG